MKRLFGYISAIIVLIALSLLFINRQWLRDEFVVRTTTLQPAAAALDSDIDLTSQAEFIYRASQPEVQAAAQFNNSCSTVAKEQSIVLGCYTASRIYIYNVSDTELDGVEQVTAAHELLHAEYARLSSAERSKVDSMVEAQLKLISDPRILQTIKQYQQTEPGQLDNEMHSIFGTEVADLSPQLENYYKRYFNDRAKIVNYSAQYEATFTSLDSQISGFDTQLSGLKTQIDTLDASLRSQQSKILADRDQLNSFASNGNTEAYNSLVPTFNSEVENYNSTLNQVKQIINQYNALVVKRNSLATTQNNLAHKLDSQYQPLSQQ